LVVGALLAAGAALRDSRISRGAIGTGVVLALDALFAFLVFGLDSEP